MIHIILVGQRNFFIEFVNAMVIALKSKGYEEIKTLFYLRKKLEAGDKINFSKDINIICTPQNIEEKYILPNNNSTCVWIQTEQIPKPTSYNKWSKVLTFFKDLENKNRMYFPCGYSESFVEHRICNHESHKFFSFGAYTPHRRNISSRYGIFHKKICHGHERNGLIKNAQINVNIKAFNKKYFFAPLHALHVICNGKILFQNSCDGDWSLYKPYVIEYNDKNSFMKLSKKWLSDGNVMMEHGIWMRDKLKSELDFTEQFLYCMEGIL